jgi:hypothetical protein
MTKLRALAAVLPAVALFYVGAPARAQVPSYSQPVLQRPTFIATFSGLAAPQTGAGDVVCLVGSATKTIRISRISVSGIKTTAQSAVVNLVRRTTASSGGTSTTAVNAKMDTTNAAPTAVLKGYTVVPTPGTGFFIRSASQGFGPGTGQPAPAMTWTFNPQEDLTQQFTLRGVLEQACVNYPNAFTTDGPALDVDFTWTEQ